MKSLYLAWQDYENRRWLPVGLLTFKDNLYKFVYTKGALESNHFSPFGRMNDLYSVYESCELFPLFSNRLMSNKRPEFKEFMKWLNLDADNLDPFTVLALTGGIRGTDNLEVFLCPEPNKEGNYELSFFNHGLSHTPAFAVETVNNLQIGEKLFLLHDVQNPYDALALAIRTDDPATIIGYCPRYLAEDFHKLLQKSPKEVTVTVVRVNYEAPLHLRLLCKITSPWEEGFKPCSHKFYEPLAGSKECRCEQCQK